MGHFAAACRGKLLDGSGAAAAPVATAWALAIMQVIRVQCILGDSGSHRESVRPDAGEELGLQVCSRPRMASAIAPAERMRHAAGCCRRTSHSETQPLDTLDWCCDEHDGRHR